MTISWSHYPANDLIAEHYSSCFGLIIRRDDGKWDGWTLTSAHRPVITQDDLQLHWPLGKSYKAAILKSKIESIAREHGQLRVKARAAHA